MQRWFRSRQQWRKRMRKIRSVRPAFASDLREEPRYTGMGQDGTGRDPLEPPPQHSHIRLVPLVQRPHLLQRLPQLLRLQHRRQLGEDEPRGVPTAAPVPSRCPRSPGRAGGARPRRAAAPAPAPPPALPPCRRGARAGKPRCPAANGRRPRGRGEARTRPLGDRPGARARRGCAESEPGVPALPPSWGGGTLGIGGVCCFFFF